MQGYVTANTIYVFLIENVMDKLHASCGITKTSEGGGESQDRLYEFHAARIHSTMEQIAFYHRKKLKAEFELRQART